METLAKGKRLCTNSTGLAGLPISHTLSGSPPGVYLIKQRSQASLWPFILFISLFLYFFIYLFFCLLYLLEYIIASDII